MTTREDGSDQFKILGVVGTVKETDQDGREIGIATGTHLEMELRQRILKAKEQDPPEEVSFKTFVEDYASYFARMRKVWILGGHPEANEAKLVLLNELVENHNKSIKPKKKKKKGEE